MYVNSVWKRDFLLLIQRFDWQFHMVFLNVFKYGNLLFLNGVCLRDQNFIIITIIFLPFLGLLLWHREVPRLGVQLEL